MSELPDWEGVPGAPEHRTVGSHRAWCFNDGEWCYPESESRLSMTVHERGWQLELVADDPAKGEWGLRSFTVTVLDGGELVDDDGLRWIASSLPGLMAYFGQRAPLLGSDESKVAAVTSSGPDGEELVRVADVYLRAVKAGQRPVVAVQRALGLKQSTANRRVRAARDLGLLPPTGKESK